MPRPVTVYKWELPNGANCSEPYEKVAIGKGKLHEFGVFYKDSKYGVGYFKGYSTALVGMENGAMVDVDVALIKFDDLAIKS